MFTMDHNHLFIIIYLINTYAPIAVINKLVFIILYSINGLLLVSYKS